MGSYSLAGLNEATLHKVVGLCSHAGLSPAAHTFLSPTISVQGVRANIYIYIKYLYNISHQFGRVGWVGLVHPAALLIWLRWVRSSRSSVGLG